MKKDVFQFTDYKAYLAHWIAQKPGRGRGLQAKIAAHIGCQSGYVSQVLNTNANFSLEQAESLNGYLAHTNEEGLFFILLVEHERAGTKALKQRFQNEIDRILNTRTNLKERFDIKKSLSETDQVTYYSSWHFAAIHVAVSVPTLRTREAIAKYFSINTEVTQKALDFLVSVGLLDKKADEYIQGVSRLFLGKDSPMIKKHHSNWRMRAMNSLDLSVEKNLHFSTVVSLSEHDLPIIKEYLIKSIDHARSIVRESKEEKVCCLNLDFFELN